jgi:hypothetical protein
MINQKYQLRAGLTGRHQGLKYFNIETRCAKTVSISPIDFIFRGRSYHCVMFEFEFVILLKKWVEL